ncbi:hypothetical protein ABDK09_02360 [Vibrio sp. CDRSL-10 TSBA]
MMYAELIDMDDFMLVMKRLGITTDERRDFEYVTSRIEQWLNEASEKDSREFWHTIDDIEEDGILLPDVENIILWSRKLPMAS